MARTKLWCLLVMLASAVLPSAAQTVSGGLAKLVQVMPAGGGWPAVLTEAQRQSDKIVGPRFHSVRAETFTFTGDIVAPYDTKLAVFTGDAFKVTIDNDSVWPGQEKAKPLSSLGDALRKLDLFLVAGTHHRLSVEYKSQPTAHHIHGITIFLYEKALPIITLDSYNNPLTATYSSPNGIDPKNVRVVYDGVNVTDKAKIDKDKLSFDANRDPYADPIKPVYIKVKDNEGNYATAGISYHGVGENFDSEGIFTMIYYLPTRTQVRMRTCRYGKDVAEYTQTATQGSGVSGMCWDGKDDKGWRADAEVYVCRIERLINGKWVRLANIL